MWVSIRVSGLELMLVLVELSLREGMQFSSRARNFNLKLILTPTVTQLLIQLADLFCKGHYRCL